MQHWGPEGPPPEAYSRVTDASRFQPLHNAALDLLRNLQSVFDAEWAEALGIDPELERAELARPTVKLEPAQSTSAPIVVAFTSFPGLAVRCGRWFIDRFPSCGCDACAETAEDEIRRLGDLFDNVTLGRFRESIKLPLIGAAWYEYELGLPWHGGAGRSRLQRSRARALLDHGPRAFAWQPWRRSRQ
jgi:hypothetical protein